MNLLAIGNSFSQDALRYLHAIAKADGLSIDTANLCIGGCSLEQHAYHLSQEDAVYEYQLNGEDRGQTTISLPKALQEKQWDIITLQQCSGLSGSIEHYFPYLSQLLEAIHNTNPAAVVAFHQTWAYDTGSQHPDFERYHHSRQAMYHAIETTVTKAVQRAGIQIVIPCGRVIEALRQTQLFDQEHGGVSLCRDSYHLDLCYGRYAAGACWYETLLSGNILHNDFQPPLSDDAPTMFKEKLDTIRRTVHTVCTTVKRDK